MDLLRCKCVGSKAEIHRIYNDILGQTDYFEVIRVKNKLNENTRDILINLKLKNSFLVCEVQLSLGKDMEEVNNHFNHYLYELCRSSFGRSAAGVRQPDLDSGPTDVVRQGEQETEV